MLYIASLIQFPLEGTAYSQGEKADPHWRFDCFTACLFLLFLMEPNHEYQHLHLVGQLARSAGPVFEGKKEHLWQTTSICIWQVVSSCCFELNWSESNLIGLILRYSSLRKWRVMCYWSSHTAFQRGSTFADCLGMAWMDFGQCTQPRLFDRW